MKNELITFESPKAQISEVFRTLRTNIQFMNVDDKLKSILITSTVPGEGKSWVAANLAVAFAQAGKKTLIVDADMRKGRQHKMFDVNNEQGLSNFLIASVKSKDTEKLKEYVKHTKVSNLYVMPAGVIPPNPSELLASRKMAELITRLENKFDIVIFDGTPSTIVTDAIILANFVNTTILVSAYKETKIDDLKQVERNIINVGGKIAGVVINKIPVSKKEYKSNYYYGESSASGKTSTKEFDSNKKESKKSVSKITNKLSMSIKKKIKDEQVSEVKKKLNKIDINNDTEVDNKVDVSKVVKELDNFVKDKK